MVKIAQEQDSGERTVTGMRFLHLTQEAPMGSIPKVVGVLACSFLLCLGLSSVAQAGNPASPADDMQAGPSDKKGGPGNLKSDQNRLKGQDGKEVGLRTDHATPNTGKMDQGDRIEADVNDRNRAKSGGSPDSTDRRNDKTEAGGGSK